MNPFAIRVLVLSNDPTFYGSLERMLLSAPRLDVRISWCREPEGIERSIESGHHDVILWDLRLTHGFDREFFDHLNETCHDCPVVALGDQCESDGCSPAFEAGLADYLCRDQLEPIGLARTLRGLGRERWLAKDQMPDVDDTEVDSILHLNQVFHQLQMALLRAGRSGRQLGLICISVPQEDRARIKAACGEGEDPMILIAGRLRQTLRRTDSLLRTSEWDFAVILEQFEATLALPPVLRKIIATFDQPLPLRKGACRANARLGVATYPENGQTAETLMHRASKALGLADNSGFRFYSFEQHVRAGEQLQLEADLRKAIRRNELELYYQPRIDREHQKVCGVECLLRWKHPERGFISPAEFIPVAERCGLIVPIGYWVVEQACAALNRSRNLECGAIKFSINLSFRQFRDPNLFENLFRILSQSKVDTSLIEFELTESAMMHDLDVTRRSLNRLRQLGVTFSLDDFGTGFSSLRTIQDLPISVLKIDKSFVHGLGERPDSHHIIRAIISLAESLGMTTVAEGVETTAQMDYLIEYNCPEIQGYLFARPMPWDALVDYLASEPFAACASNFA